jgi:hypothetical protein
MFATASSSPGSRRPPRSGRLFWRLGLVSRLVLMLVVVSVAGVGLLTTGRDVWIYVDNGGSAPMVVTIDGKAATIDPGAFVLIKCQPGEKQIQVRSGDKVLFDGVKDLQKSDKLATSRRYLFNPDGRNRYLTYTVHYGTDPLEVLFGSKEDKLPEDQRAAVRAAYQQMAGQVELLPADPWFEVPSGAYVLTPAPASVTTSSYTEQRTVLARVEPKDYAFLAAARDKQDPTEEDLDALGEVLDRVFDGQP